MGCKENLTHSAGSSRLCINPAHPVNPPNPDQKKRSSERRPFTVLIEEVIKLSFGICF
jgi:hypothetical protein